MARITVYNMKIILPVVALCLATAAASAQTAPTQDSLLSENTVKVSDHVWAIMGWPNIGIVVGETATLVVDTGLGARNGATAARVAKKLSPNNKLYLTTTHFHPEHAAGEAGFPAGTILIRDKVQQDEMDKHGEEMIHLFESRNDTWRALLANVKLRAPDKTFDKELELDLGGGVKARLLWFGGAHTKGDELTFVEPDKTLISGDVVQNKVVPNISRDGGTPSSWIAVLEQLEKLGAAHVLPTHSPVGDGSLVAKEKAFIVDLRTRALELKNRGIDADEAGRSLTAEFKTKYPDWPINNVTNFVKSIYAELRERPALVDYFPPAEDHGGWRSLLPEKGDPDQKQKAAIREVAGVDWDKLQEAWRHNEAADGPTGLLVIRRGQVVGEWYKDCDRKSDFNIYSCSKAYTSTAFGLILTDFGAAADAGIKPLTLDTKVCNAEWIPEALPLTDARKSEITVRHLLNMVSGFGDENPPDPPGGKSPFEPKGKPFEWCLGHIEGSPMAKLKTDPGKAFHYSNAGVAHLVLLFHRATGSDLYPFMKERVFNPDRRETDSLDCQRRRRGDWSIQSRVQRRDDDRARTRPFLLPVTAPR